MPATLRKRTRKRQRRPSWKLEEMSIQPSKMRRVETHEAYSDSDLEGLHDLGMSDDDEPSLSSGVRPKLPTRLRIRAPKDSTLDNSPLNVSDETRSVPAKLRVRPASKLKPDVAEEHREIFVRVRLRNPSLEKKRCVGSFAANLPRDVLLKIFAHLPAVPDLCMISQVCTHWADVAINPALWVYVKATDAATRRLLRDESQSNYQHICYDTPFLGASTPKRKRKRGKLNGVGQAVEVITRRSAGRLVSLDLEDCFPLHHKDRYQMQNTDLEKIAQRCASSIEELRISPSPQISGQALLSFARSCPKLRVLHMSGCRTLSCSHFGDIIRACPALEDISVSQCQAFRGSRLSDRLDPIRLTLKRLDISDTPTTRFPISKFASKYPVLEEVKMDNCEYMHILDHAPNVADLENRLFPSLVSLIMDKISHLPMPWLSAICRMCSSLQILSANKVQQPHSMIGDLFKGPLPRLHHLSLAGQPIDDDAWQRIFDKLRRCLVQCDLSRNSSLTCMLYSEDDQTFEALEELNISGTGATDMTVQEVMRLAPKLTFFDVTGCRSVENRDLRRNPLLFRAT